MIEWWCPLSELNFLFFSVENISLPTSLTFNNPKFEDASVIAAVDPTKIRYEFLRKGSESGSIIYSNDIRKLNSTRFDGSLESVYLIHDWNNTDGWKNSFNPYIYKTILKYFDVNIFVVDWTTYSESLYASSLTTVPEVMNIFNFF